ncbi:S-layer homology domain-containing protein [Paenibacillus polysaccharolyticus]|nr:S-layer homology domain-containing protein [Paenibacillus polysaccharolyticus]
MGLKKNPLKILRLCCEGKIYLRKWSSLLVAGLIFSNSLGMGVHAESGPKEQGNNYSGTVTTVLKDIENHWAKESITRWMDRGVVQGKENHLFAPNQQITRAEWVSMINRIFQYQKNGETSFSDVSLSKWYHEDIVAASANGYIMGYEDGTFKPDGIITRAEAAVTLSRIFNWEGSPTSTFHDDMDIKQWSKEAVSAAAHRKIILGYENGAFLPEKTLTRAEAISILSRAFEGYGTWYEKAGEYGQLDPNHKSVEKNVIINGSGITLNNMTIDGDLIIGKNVGRGDVYLKNVEVKGNTYVYGGGEHSVHVENSRLIKVIVHKLDGSVRLAVGGKTTIQDIVVQSSAIIEPLQGVVIKNTTISDQLEENQNVLLKGDFEKVKVDAPNLSILIPEGTIKDLEFTHSSKGTSVNQDQDSKILSAVLNAAVKIQGKGKILEAIINSSGVSLDQAPNQVKLGKDITKDTTLQIGGSNRSVSSMGNSTVLPPAINTGSATVDTSGSGGGQSSSPTTPVTPSPVEIVGEEYGARDDGDMFWPGIESTTVTAGESIHVYSPRSGNVYISTLEVTSQNPVELQEAIRTGQAMKFPIKANVRTSIPISLMKGYDQFGVLVIDEKGNSTFRTYLRALDGTGEKLVRKDALIGLIWKENFELYEVHFNRFIKANGVENLKDYIRVSEGSNDEDFTPLAEGDQVEIRDNALVIKTKIPMRGKNLRILEGAVTTTDNDYTNETITWDNIRSLTRATFADKPNEEFITLPVGSVIKFNVNYGGEDAYFVKENLANVEAFEEAVADGTGLKLSIPEDGTDQTYEFDTANFLPGDYVIRVMDAYILSVHLTAK